MEVCTLELERQGPSYTIDTLRSIHAENPDAELTLIVGADVASTLGSWRDPGEILRLSSLAVAEREGSARREVSEALAPLGGRERAVFLEMAPREVSSSLVRRRITGGEPIEQLVGGAVADYIAEHQLYGRRPVGSTDGAGR
jgi:nicotinate-nucleotide adenylyltransferase